MQMCMIKFCYNKLSKYNYRGSFTAMSKYLKSSKISEIPKLHLENKFMPHSLVKENENIFEYTSSGQYKYISTARTSQPLIASMAAVYFQVKIIHSSLHSEIGIGLMHKDCDLNKHPGKNIRSVGFISNGDLYVCKKKQKSLKSFKSGSIIGMGIKFAKRQIFVTLDGKLLGTVAISKEHFQPKYSPCVSLRNKGDKVKIYFENFKFNFSNFLKEIELECEQQIQQEPIKEYDHAKIIADYLQFYGYSKTLKKFKEQEKIQQNNCYQEHPFIQKKIKVGGNKEQEINDSAFKSGKKIFSEVQLDSDREKFTPLRQRIMSEYIGDVVPVQVVRKRTYDFQRELFESKRKSSVIVIEDSDFGQHQKKEETGNNNKKFIYDQKTTQFLNNDRITILRYLRDERIEEAQKLLLQKLPEIFQIHRFLHSYFEMQMYLKILRLQGVIQVRKYVKDHIVNFKNYQKQQFPVYRADGSRQFKEFQYFMSLITQKNYIQNSVVSPLQLQGFADHINELILQSLGLYYQSRLDLLINHIRTIGRKAEQHQIPGQFQNNDF